MSSGVYCFHINFLTQITWSRLLNHVFTINNFKRTSTVSVLRLHSSARDFIVATAREQFHSTAKRKLNRNNTAARVRGGCERAAILNFFAVCAHITECKEIHSNSNVVNVKVYCSRVGIQNVCWSRLFAAKCACPSRNYVQRTASFACTRDTHSNTSVQRHKPS